MSRGRKILLIAGGGLLGLTALVFIAGIIVVRTEWFRDTVRAKIVSAVEEGTGGKASIGAFAFDWTQLRADIGNFVIHGLEPADAAPLFRASRIQVQLKAAALLKGAFQLAYLGVDEPQANIIVFPDGRTNVPSPKVKKKSDRSALETVVDLAVGRFDLRNGSVAFAEQKTALNASGRNLRAQLNYSLLKDSYTGELAVSPLYLKSGANEPVNVDVKLPVTLERDRIALADGRFSTPDSEIVVSGAMERLQDPRIKAHVNARISLDEVRRAAGINQLDTRRGPRVLTADVTASMADQRIDIANARVKAGASGIEASGVLRDPRRRGNLQFDADLALGELAALLKSNVQPTGTVRIGGNAALTPDGDYAVTANVLGRGLEVRSGQTRIPGIDLNAAVSADPKRVALGGLRLSALGGSITGSGALEDMRQLRFDGRLDGFDIGRVMAVFSPGRLGYTGVVSGPVRAAGDLKNNAGMAARADLAIAPGRPPGIPVSGRVNVNYNGAASTVEIGQSFLQLPHTRVDLSGALNRSVQLRAASKDLSDFSPLGAIPVKLNGGAAVVNATATGNLDAPRITGDVAVTNFSVEGRNFTRLAANLQGSPSGVQITNGTLAARAVEAQFSGAAGLRKWKTESAQPVKLDAAVVRGDVRDLLALAGQSNIPVTGALTSDVHVTGTMGDPRGNAEVRIVNGEIQGQPFDTFTARAVMGERTVEIPSLQLIAQQSRIDASAVYDHPPGDLKAGTVRAQLTSNQVQLASLQPLIKARPGLAGAASIKANVAGDVRPSKTGSEFVLTSLDAQAAARGLQVEGKAMGDLTATARSAGSVVRYNVTSNLAGSDIRVNGESEIAGEHRTTATASISGLAVEQALLLAGQKSIPVTGRLSANAQVSGTLADPNVTAKAELLNGAAYGQRVDRAEVDATYSNALVNVALARVTSGPSTIEANGSLTHPKGDLQHGDLKFQVGSNRVQLANIVPLQRARPGLAGVVELALDGAATLKGSDIPLFSALNAKMAANDLSLEKRRAGDLTLTAETRGGDLDFTLNSDLAGSQIKGAGKMRLSGDYPVNAQASFTNVTYSGMSRVLEAAPPQNVEATAAGQLEISGPALRSQDIKGTLRLTMLEAHSVTPAAGTKPRVDLKIQNQGDIVVALDRSVVTIKNFQLAGPNTTLALAGSAPLTGPQPIKVTADGNVDLTMLEAFDPDIFSSGKIVLKAAVTGTVAKPVVNGRLELQNASVNSVNLPAGLSNASGAVLFTGTEAVIQNISGESGGGKVTLSGNIGYGGPQMQVRVQATADKVRVRYPENLSSEVSARIALAGNTTRSLVSGTVTVTDIAMHSQGDIGSILSGAATPPSSPEVRTGFLGGMRFDVKIQTAPEMQLRTSMAQNVRLEASLTLRGSLDNPGMLGRASISQGDVVFFGSKYTIDQGTVTFNNPSRINPLVAIDLHTTAQGIDVSISVSGPMDRLKLTYRSDPPMPFSDLVSLLASGKVSTTDPVLAARQPNPPQQNLTQMGASTLLGQAVANPVSSRLQRLFGVTKLKIDPQVSGATNTPQATMTLQQQITRELTFTYIQDVTQSNPQAVRIEWNINPQWSAVAQRDINGMFDLDFLYRKRFR